MIEIRVRNKISKIELEQKVNKIVTDADSNIRLTGPTRVRRPDGQPLCVYLPGAVREEITAAYPTLATIRGKTENRGLASGSVRVPDKVVAGKTIRTRAMPVTSSVLGAMESTGIYKFCRLTSFTAQQVEKWGELLPLFRAVAALFETHVPDRYAKQVKYAASTAPDWVIPDTPFTTITVNNSYATGVHTDKGDLDEGFSCLAVARRGNFTGGVFTFPEYRISADLQDGDLVLMDAHDWHGNTAIYCECGNMLSQGPCLTCGAERISVVHYYRTRMKACGTAEAETARRLAQFEHSDI